MKLQILTTLTVLLPLLVVCFQNFKHQLPNKDDPTGQEIKPDGTVGTIQHGIGEVVDGRRLLSSRKEFGRRRKIGKWFKKTVKKVFGKSKKNVDKETINKWAEDCGQPGVLMAQDKEERGDRRRRAEATCATPSKTATCPEHGCTCFTTALNHCKSCCSDAIEKCMTDTACGVTEVCEGWKNEYCSSSSSSLISRAEVLIQRSQVEEQDTALGNTEERMNTNSSAGASLDSSLAGKCTSESQ